MSKTRTPVDNSLTTDGCTCVFDRENVDGTHFISALPGNAATQHMAMVHTRGTRTINEFSVTGDFSHPRAL